jgi:hypothetical protein
VRWTRATAVSARPQLPAPHDPGVELLVSGVAHFGVRLQGAVAPGRAPGFVVSRAVERSADRAEAHPLLPEAGGRERLAQVEPELFERPLVLAPIRSISKGAGRGRKKEGRGFACVTVSECGPATRPPSTPDRGNPDAGDIFTRSRISAGRTTRPACPSGGETRMSRRHDRGMVLAVLFFVLLASAGVATFLSRAVVDGMAAKSRRRGAPGVGARECGLPSLRYSRTS